jgi:hypothetical protein
MHQIYGNMQIKANICNTKNAGKMQIYEVNSSNMQKKICTNMPQHATENIAHTQLYKVTCR